MSEVIYRIAKWQEVFERAESRKLKSLSWVAIPTSFSSNGFQLMLDEFGEDAPAIYGAWCALVAFAASCTVRGTLANSRGNPLKISHVARIIGFGTPTMTRMMQWAMQDNVAWLIPAQPHEIPQNTEGSSVSGESPDVSGESPDYQTSTDKTRHNITRHDIDRQTAGPDVVGQKSVVEVLKKFDREKAMRLASKLRKAVPELRKRPTAGRVTFF